MRLFKVFSSRPRPPARKIRTRADGRRLFLEGLEDRLVPSVVFHSGAATSTSDNGGLVLGHAHVELVFWGGGWDTGSGPSLRTSVQTAATNITAGPYVTALSEYRGTIGAASVAGAVTITSSSPPAVFNDGNVSSMLSTNISNGTLPNPDSDSQLLYLVIPQPGSGAGAAGGKHSYFTRGAGHSNAHYSWTVDNTSVNGSALDTVTYFYSHELAESVSDPEGSAVQVNPRDSSAWNEICDGEAQSYSYRLNGSLVQSWFSAQRHAYVVPTGQSQNFLVSTGNVLTVNGDQLASHNDTITIDTLNNGVKVTLNGEVAQFDPGKVSSIVVNTGGGVDTVNVLRTLAGVPVTVSSAGAATVNLGTGGSVQGILGAVTVVNGSGGDTLTVDDSADGVTRAVTVGAGGVTGLAPAALSFAPSSIDTLTISGGNGNNTYNVAATPARTSVTLNTGGGTDTVNVQASTAPLTVNGAGGGNDVVNLGRANSLAGLAAPVTLENGTSLFRVNVNDASDPADHANVVLTDGGLTGLSDGAINFGPLSVSALTVNGGGGSNTYTINNPQGYLGTVLNTGSGVDSVSVQGTVNPLTINSASGGGADAITLGDASGTLSGILAAVTVNAAATDSLTFADQGFAGGRTFTVTDTTLDWGGPTVTYSGLGAVTIDGGSGGNTFAVLASSPTAAVTLAGGGGDTLVGSDAGNLFALTGANAGTLGGGAYGSAVGFSGVANLTAGGGGDTIQFADGASLSGNLVGGGADALDYTAYTTSVVVDLPTGAATGVGGVVSGVATVLGGSAAPAGGGVYNLLIGAGGDTLVGGTGRRNLLVAGGSSSTLVGGDGEDLLIAGSTAYDGDPALSNWLQVAAYWAGADDYLTRVANLTGGSGVPLLDATVASGNGGGNVVSGTGALALLYTDGADSIGSFDPTALLLTITP